MPKIKINRDRFAVAAVWIMRLVVGFVFVLSGFAKAIDPWGTVYKFTDYVNILGLQSLESLVTFGAFALPIVEFLIGVFILFGLFVLFIVIVVFTLCW